MTPEDATKEIWALVGDYLPEEAKEEILKIVQKIKEE